MVEHGDLVMGHVGIGSVEVDPLLDDGLIVGVQRQVAGIEGSGTAEAACLNFENIVAAIPVRIDPLADRITQEGRFPRAKGARP